MRTTVTLDSDTEQIVRRRMREKGETFKAALNEAIRAGTAGSAKPFRTRTFAMGEPTVSLDRALQLVGELEDEEVIRDLRIGT